MEDENLRDFLFTGRFCYSDYPHALAQYVNQAPADQQPNCILVPLSVPGSSLQHANFLPTVFQHTKPPPATIPVVALVALCDIKPGQELFTNYAYPCGPDGRDCPDWYTVYTWLSPKDGRPQPGYFAKKLDSRASKSLLRGANEPV